MKKPIRILTLALALCLTIGLVTTADAEADWTTKPITITMMHGISEESEKSIVTSAAFREMINIFKEDHPNVTIEENVIPDSYNTVVQQYAAADDLPMVFSYLYAHLDTMAGGGLAANIKDDVDPSVYLDNLASCIYKDGGIYGLNMKFTDYNLCFYNEQMLLEATGSTEFPKTWDEFLALDEYFDAKGIDLVSLGNAWKWFAVVSVFNPFINEFCGPDFLDSMIAGDGAFSWNSDEFKRVVNESAKLAAVCNPDFNTLDDVSAIGNYAAGKAFCTMYGGWASGTISKYLEDYPDVVNSTRCTLVPTFSGKEEDISIVYASTETYAINSKVTGDEYEACLALIKQLASTDYAEYNAARGNTAPAKIDLTNVNLSDKLPMIQDFMKIHTTGYGTIKSVFTYLPTTINDAFLNDSQLVLAGAMTADEMAEDLQMYQEEYEASQK